MYSKRWNRGCFDCKTGRRLTCEPRRRPQVGSILRNGREKRIFKHPPSSGIYQTQNKNPDIVPTKCLESSDEFEDDDDDDDDDDDIRSDLTRTRNGVLPPIEIIEIDDPKGLCKSIVRRADEIYRLAVGSSSDAIGAEGKLEVDDLDLFATRPENGVSVVGSPCDPLDEDRRLEEEALRKVEEKIANKKKQTSIVKSPARIPIKKKKKMTALLTLNKRQQRRRLVTSHGRKCFLSPLEGLSTRK